MSDIRVDTISAANGTDPVTLTKQSAAKVWVNFDGTGSYSTRDSFNVSSLTDISPGETYVNFTTNMLNANYSATTIPRINASIKGTVASYHQPYHLRVQSRNTTISGTLADSDYNCYTINGDLA